MNTTGIGFSFIFFITSSVNFSQPSALCDNGLSFSTVNNEFKRSTPSCAHFTSDPDWGSLYPRSFSSSLNIFFSDGGFLIPSFTENDRPSASPSPW